jgi:hypothetical protein
MRPRFFFNFQNGLFRQRHLLAKLVLLTQLSTLVLTTLPNISWAQINQAEDRQNTLGQIEKLRKTIQNRAKKISKKKYSEISAHLTSAIEIALNNEEDVLACLKTSPAELTVEQKDRLCKGSTPEAVTCFEAASERMSIEERLELCELGGTPQRVTCYDSAATSIKSARRIKDCVQKVGAY